MAKYNTDKVVRLQNKEYILFQGLLEIAHAEFDLKEIKTEMIELPCDKNGNRAVCKATVIADDQKVFTGYGDADPSNVNKMIAKHLIRMAETRAIARALRFLTGYGTVFEELGDLHEDKNEKKSETNKEQAFLYGAVKAKCLQLAKIRNTTLDTVLKTLCGCFEIDSLEIANVSILNKMLIQLKTWENQAYKGIVAN